MKGEWAMNTPRNRCLYYKIRPDIDAVFYVGIGYHYRANKLDRVNPHYRAVVAKLKRMGLKPEVDIVVSGLTFDEAGVLEREHIARLRKAGAPLTNIALGGNGIGMHAPESKEKMSKSLRESPKAQAQRAALNNDPEFQARRLEQLSDWHASEAGKAARAKALAKAQAAAAEARRVLGEPFSDFVNRLVAEGHTWTEALLIANKERKDTDATANERKGWGMTYRRAVKSNDQQKLDALRLEIGDEEYAGVVKRCNSKKNINEREKRKTRPQRIRGTPEYAAYRVEYKMRNDARKLKKKGEANEKNS
jgi:hypothetical protein